MIDWRRTMKRRIVLYAAVVLVTLSLAACNMPSQTQGPTTWIDRPLDGDHVPLASLAIQAHASDANGVATIEFYISESLLAAVPAGGGRLGEASIEWMPPGPGIYTIGAGAVDSQGNSGPTTGVQIVVGASDLTTETPTPAPASPQCAVGALVAPVLLSPADGAMVGPEPLLAWSYPDETCHPHSYRIDISEDASFSDVGWGFGTLDYNETSRQWPLPPGKCYYWRALAYVPDVNGPASPAWTFCVEGATPTPTPAPAIGTATPTPTPAPAIGTATPTPTPAPALATPIPTPAPALATPTPTSVPDTTPPDISDLSANPAIISVQVPCGATPATTVIRARVTDPGGIARVVARVSGFGEFEMSAAGDGYYQVTLGPFGEAGTLSIFIQALDNAGNTATSAPIEVQVVACPG